MTLLVRGSEAKSVFSLLGFGENSATFALGWVLEQCPSLRAKLFAKLLNDPCEGTATIALQKHVSQGGFTDIELWIGQRFHVIVEAKIGWALPSIVQLRGYRARMGQDPAMTSKILTVSAADEHYAALYLPKVIDGVEVQHLSWGDITHLADEAYPLCHTNEQKMWLRQLNEHLRGYASMDRRNSNSVYVVSLSGDAIKEGSGHTWIDVVTGEGRYFHPVGNSWPAEPPNYIAFRYWGQLQSVHHIRGTTVVRDLSAVNPMWPESDADHFIYELGPVMKPPKDVRTGNLFRSARTWCAIDTLLSGEFETISDAANETKRRVEE